MTSRPLVSCSPLRFAAVLVGAAIVAPAAAAAAEPVAAPTATATALPPSAGRFGVAVQMPRWVAVPGWVLDLFTAENVPLSTFGVYGLEAFYRHPGYDIVLGLFYQNMSPADGNWLGKGRDASVDTDFVQPRGIALLGADISFVVRRMFTEHFGIHYGAGLGLAKVLGHVYRISNSTACTAANAGDERACRPKFCPAGGCTEAMLADSERGVDGGPEFPARFKDPDIPGAFPVLNLITGVDFRVPQVRGLELRIDGGFRDGFFVGSSVGYVF